MNVPRAVQMLACTCKPLYVAVGNTPTEKAADLADHILGEADATETMKEAADIVKTWAAAQE